MFITVFTKKPTAGPYPEPDELNPHPPNPFTFYFNIISHLSLGIPSGLFSVSSLQIKVKVKVK
jgi:hypothetical protein